MVIAIFSTLWGILLASHIVFGQILKFYDRTKWFDLVLHTCAGALIAATSLALLSMVSGVRPILTALFAFCITMTVGILWEFGEFALDRIFKTNTQRWKDGPNAAIVDSMTDLMANGAGAILACVVYLLI